MRRVLTALLLLAGLAALPATPAYAAGLTPVTGFGSNPGALAMYAYRPDGLAAGAPLVVALHGCTQSAQDYHDHAGWAKFADAYGFTVVYPQQSTANNATSCFNWYQTGDTTRGQGEVLSVKQMVDYAVATYGSDPSRVYVTGLSAGGAMTSALLATYPDVFAGGAVVAGLPYRCATDLTSAYTCMYTATSKTPAQWGDLVRAADPGYGGARPRVAIWYGTADYTVNPVNATESRDQWTDVLGVSRTPTGTATLPGGTTVQYYGDAVALYGVPGIGHGTPVDPGSDANQCGATGTYYPASICSSSYIASFWGLAG